MTKVLVTGANGFLGAVVVKELSQAGYEVRALVRSLSNTVKFPADVEVVTGDIRDAVVTKQVAAGCEGIIHLAGKVHAIDEREGNEGDYYQTNVEGTRHVLEGAATAHVQRVIFASSVKVFGKSTEGCVDETASPTPQTAYARSKWQAEKLVSEYGKRTGTVAVSLRLPMVYGPTEKGNLYRMISAIDHGRFPPFPKIDNQRSLVHVRNVAQAMLCCLRQTRTRLSAYIVADAQPYSTTHLYESLCRGLGKRLPSWRVPLGLLKAAARFGDLVQIGTGRTFALTTSTLGKLIESAWYSPAAIARDCGYSPFYSFDDAVPEIVNFYRMSTT
ncbi:MAG TPA: NAD-dependent epimerase/dehydratase family protein [Nitrospiraceae bacterium]|nr:NAD-dependent epimerase/dehydratase family protein [Nitrospiraceae bacterium]